MSQQKPEDAGNELVHPWTSEEVKQYIEELNKRHPWPTPEEMEERRRHAGPEPDLTVVDPD